MEPGMLSVAQAAKAALADIKNAAAPLSVVVIKRLKVMLSSLYYVVTAMQKLGHVIPMIG
tara:strand:- start:787 stop:966 length:180 start_codon:yes stop_codon:yes gene_type:complete